MKKWGVFLIIIMIFLSGCTSINDKKDSETSVSFDTLNNDYDYIATEAYIYLYPLVLMDVTRKQMTNVESLDLENNRAPENEFVHFKTYPPLDFKDVVRPNFDTLYSIAWANIEKEPVILHLPNSNGRYYLMPSIDMWTDVFSVPGWRTSGTDVQEYAFVNPGWKGILPEGVVKVEAPNPVFWFIARIQTNGPDDYDQVHKFQDGIYLVPLSKYSQGSNWEPSLNEVDPNINMVKAPLETVEDMSSKEFFERASDLMKEFKPHNFDYSEVFRLERIGIEPGKSFDYESLNEKQKIAVDNAKVNGLKLIKAYIPKMAKVENGWQMNLDTMGVYGISYLKRASVALMGLGANQVADAFYPNFVNDADGNPLDAKNKYILHFDKDELPPVGAFWSLTMYDSKGFAIPNEINRATISSWMDLTYNEDGSLDIYIQHNKPDEDKLSNWLPTPESGKLEPTMRLYAPKIEALAGLWKMPFIKKID